MSTLGKGSWRFVVIEHRLQAFEGAQPHLFGELHAVLRLGIFEDPQNIFEGIGFHIFAHGAAAD